LHSSQRSEEWIEQISKLALMVQAGLTPIQAITVATLNGAKLLHIEDQYGTLAAGQKPDFVVLEKDPPQDIHNTQTIRAVWKDGNKVSDGPLAAGISAMLR
jgi:imidazolonepropionase-like amidohydrolase